LPQLFGAYAPLGLIMEFVFFVVFLASMHLLRRDKWVEGFEYNITPALTALGTCSSIATIPANLRSNRKDANTSILETSLFR
jgi:Na+/H+-dicarboxylate symporter